MSAKGLWIIGTDTGVGKTLIASLCLIALRERGIPRGYLKPVQTGTDDDTLEARRLAELGRDEIAGPVYRFPEPIAPSRAARLHGESIRLETLLAFWRELDPGGSRYWIVEAAGGLMCPLNDRDTFRELIPGTGLPALLVASTRLGTINHTLLTLEAARGAGIRVAGVILSGEPDPGLARELEALGRAPVLVELPPLCPPATLVSREAASRAGREIFSRSGLWTC